MPQVVSSDMTKMKHPVVAMARPVATGILGVVVSIGLSGCAGFYQQHRDFQNGWRTGEIVEIGRATEIQRSGRTDCRKTVSPNELALNRFAILADRSLQEAVHQHRVLLADLQRLTEGCLEAFLIVADRRHSPTFHENFRSEFAW